MGYRTILSPMVMFLGYTSTENLLAVVNANVIIKIYGWFYVPFLSNEMEIVVNKCLYSKSPKIRLTPTKENKTKQDGSFCFR